jgi:Leucine-rich repeat (LRR) protein
VHILRVLQHLRELGLFFLTKLESLQGVEDLTSLEILNIETCKKISSIEQVSKLTNLRQIAFANCGDIESIEPLRNLKKLEILHFYDSTNVLDGDLSALTELPNLKDVRFMNRKHYSLRCEQFAPFGDNPEYPKQVNSGDR